MKTDELVRNQTRMWLEKVVVGFNFCPFANREVRKGSIRYSVYREVEESKVIDALIKELELMEESEEIETCLMIFPEGLDSFDAYLKLLLKCEKVLKKEDFEGIFQIASFHPNYLFAGTSDEDASNYTNRSPYPMFHLLREDSLSQAIDRYPNIDEIPSRNIDYTKNKGLEFMKKNLEEILKSNGL